MTLPCGCCEGIQVITPAGIWNRPGLEALSYRVGTYSAFFETMLARISTLSIPIPAANPADPPTLVYPLRNLTTRDSSDPAIALLDAWAVVADVLTFYQERITNEGYLRTAIERRSILELARLIGYRLRPGVSASVFLAFTLQQGNVVDVPVGTQAQSVPGPGELPQYFETSAVLPARDVWNGLQPRLTRPQLITWDGDTVYDVRNIDTVYFAGTSTNLNPNDPLLIVSENAGDSPVLRKVETVTPDSDNKRTKVTLQLLPSLSGSLSELLTLASDMDTNLNQQIKVGQQDFPGIGMAETIVAALTALRDALEHAVSTSDVESFLESLRKTLAFLREQKAIADERNYTRLAPWIKDMLTALEPDLAKFTSIAPALRSGAPTGAAVSPGVASGPGPSDRKSSQKDISPLDRLGSLLGPLSLPPSLQPANSIRLARALPQSFGATSSTAADGTTRILKLLRSDAAPQLYKAWSDVSTNPPNFHVFALRVKASLFGGGAPKEARYQPATTTTGQTTTANLNAGDILPQDQWPDWKIATDEKNNLLFLERNFDQIQQGTYVAIQKAGSSIPQVFANITVSQISRNAYGVSSKTTKIALAGTDQWWDTQKDDFSTIRQSLVFAQSEELTLAEAPIDEDVAGSQIELAQLYDGLDSGRWVVVSGQRTDTPGVTGVTANELVMLSAVNQGFGNIPNVADPNNPHIPPGEKVHTTIVLANDLAYTYDRSTLKIYANVIKATHGKSQAEALGSGDGSKTLQTFPLHQPPLTYLPAATPVGAASTLQVRVNDILWHEVNNLTLMGPGDHSYLTQADNNDVTSTIFGTGPRGSRLPTGPENVKAAYRNGIGKAGNVAAQQISQLVTRPLGVKDVINPLPASGGADRDSVQQARGNAPLAVMSLDRIVSIQDYSDFARSYAGIGKASSARFFGRSASLVHVTIAGVDDIPIATTSDLYLNLVQALQQYGDPYEPIQVDLRNLIILIISARVRVAPDYIWEKVEPQVRAALADKFGFPNRSLGQDALLSVFISTIQAVQGVEYVEVDGFGGVPDTNPDGTPVDPKSLLKAIHAQLVGADGTPVPPKNRIRVQLDSQDKYGIHPAQLAYLSPAYPDSLILKEITP